MSKWAWLFFCVVIASCTTTDLGSGGGSWTTLKLANGRASVEIPGRPQARYAERKDEDLGVIGMVRTWNSTRDGRSFVVTLYQAPEFANDLTMGNFPVTLDGEGKVIARREVLRAALTGEVVDIASELDGDNSRFRIMRYVFGRRGIALAFAAEDGALDHPDAVRFFDSLTMDAG